MADRQIALTSRAVLERRSPTLVRLGDLRTIIWPPQWVTYGAWLTLVNVTLDDGVYTAHLNSNPTSLCAQPAGLIFGIAPYQTWLQVTGDGGGNWSLKYVQPQTTYTISAAFMDLCGGVYHSEDLTVYFEPF